jgi:nucleoside-diphosphate-sugar epimerase
MDHLFGVNTFGLIKAAKASYEKNVKFFCHASTGNVYAPSFQPLKEDHPIRRDNPYVLSKVMAEEILDLLDGAANFLSVRLFGLFGPGQRGMLPSRIEESVRSQKKIYLEQSPNDPKEDGGLRVSFMFVKDTADCLVRLAQLGVEGATLPARLNVAGKEEITIRRFAETVGKILGKKPIFERTDQPRKFDLIADVSRLLELVEPTFTPFEEAITRTLTLQ